MAQVADTPRAEAFAYEALVKKAQTSDNQRAKEELAHSAEGQQLRGERLVPQTKTITAKDLGVDFALPIFVIQGVDDFTTPTELARRYVDKILNRWSDVRVVSGTFVLNKRIDRCLRSDAESSLADSLTRLLILS